MWVLIARFPAFNSTTVHQTKEASYGRVEYAVCRDWCTRGFSLIRARKFTKTEQELILRSLDYAERVLRDPVTAEELARVVRRLENENYPEVPLDRRVIRRALDLLLQDAGQIRLRVVQFEHGGLTVARHYPEVNSHRRHVMVSLDTRAMDLYVEYYRSLDSAARQGAIRFLASSLVHEIAHEYGFDHPGDGYAARYEDQSVFITALSDYVQSGRVGTR